MFRTIVYYIEKFKKNIAKNFSPTRIKKYGIRFSILEFSIFCLHRNNSKLERWLIKKKDLIVQKYIYENYANIIENVRENNEE